MTYDLAKKLKDAGFPKKWKPIDYATEEIWTEERRYNMPSLDELIEACEERFGDLALKDYQPTANSQWLASPNYDTSMDVVDCAGFTPTEAVANLWLKLNEK